MNPRWVIVLCNILDGHDAGLYDANFLKQAIEWWRDEFLWRKSAYPTETEDDHLAVTLDTLLVPDALSKFKPGRPKPDFQLKCRTRNGVENYAHSMSAESFLTWVLHDVDRRTLASDGLLSLGTPRFVDQDDYPVVRIGDGKNVGQTGKVAFLALFSAIEPLLTASTKANDVRDGLGLVHWKKYGEYVLLEIEASDLEKLCLGRPTFVDAGSHRRFKATANDPANQVKSDWGFTLNLNDFTQTGKPIDGMAERVCEQIKQSDVSSLKLYPLGQITAEDRGATPSDDDEKYSNCLRGIRSVVDIVTRIKGFV